MSQMAHPLFSFISPNTLKNKILYLNLQKPKFWNYGKLYQIRLGYETPA